MSPEVLSEREVERVIRSALEAAKAQGRDGLTTAELEQVVGWAHEARVTATLLEQVLAGRVGCYPRDGEIIFALCRPADPRDGGPR
jgi:hypothetical protein